MSRQAKIRLATEHDLPRLIELYSQLELDASRETVGPPILPSYLKALDEIVGDPRQQLFVVEAEDRVVGTACLVITPNLTHRGRPYAIVENVVVAADLRGLGYGELVMRHIIEQARSAGCYKIALTSNQQRVDAHRFYEKLGFVTKQRSFRVDFD